MRKFSKRTLKEAGTSPGTVIHVGDRRVERTSIMVIDYAGDAFNERNILNIGELRDMKGTPAVSWINVIGIHDVDVIQAIGNRFDIHPLTLEDIVNTGQRPKSEEYDGYVYFVMKMLHYDETSEEIRSEQISMILGRSFLVSFQESEEDVFAPVRDRVRKGRGRIRQKSCDYMAYSLIDTIVDNYFIILEKIGEKMEILDEGLFDQPGPETLQLIHRMKRELIYMRKQVWPIRELISKTVKGEFELIQEASTLYFNDVHDHIIQVIDTIDSYRDLLSGMTELYLSTISNQMNEIMKVLTIIATIFIPITFVVGVYGMNFKFMPELGWRWGYAMVWAVMIIAVAVMLSYFKKNKWI